MSKDQLWDLYVTKNPSFAENEAILMSPDKIKKMFDLTYDKAYEHGKVVGENVANLMNGYRSKSNPFEGLF